MWLWRAAVRALLDGRDFEPTVIWPELDESFAAQTAGGWGGVYRWCRQAVEQVGGPARSNPVFEFHDVLVIQVDADVARRKYSDYKITDAPTTICLARRVVRLRARRQTLYVTVILGWLDEGSLPPGAVLCTPSKSIET